MTAPVSELVALAVLVAALLGAAISDIRRYLIPNRYPAAIVLAYFVYATSHPLDQALWGLAAGMAALVLCAAFFAAGIVGGGDAKLLAATMLWAGPSLAPLFLMSTVLAGGLLALAWLTPFRRLMPNAPAAVQPSAETGLAQGGLRSRFHQPTPYGAAIAAGGFYVTALRALS
jgi:prepilin peptidase CpaA